MKMENTQRLWAMYIVPSLDFLTINGLTAERHLIVGGAKLNQPKYFTGSAFVSTEGEKLWISSRLICFG